MHCPLVLACPAVSHFGSVVQACFVGCLALPCRYFDFFLHIGIVFQDPCQHSCIALQLFALSFRLHRMFAITAELSNSDLCFRITRIALPCLAQHVQPRNGFAMLDEQRP